MRSDVTYFSHYSFVDVHDVRSSSPGEGAVKESFGGVGPPRPSKKEKHSFRYPVLGTVYELSQPGHDLFSLN